MANPRSKRRTREDREEAFRRQAEARARGGAPGGVQQRAFNPNPPTAQPASVGFRVTHHTEMGDVEVDPNALRQQARQVLSEPGQTPAQQPYPQPGQPPMQQGQMPPQYPQGMPQQPFPPQMPPQQAGAPVPQQRVPYGSPNMPVTRGEVPPSSAPAPNSTAPIPQRPQVSPGMHPSHMQVTRGVFAPGMSQHQPPPSGAAQPLQAVVEHVDASELEDIEPLDLTVIFTSWSRPGLLRPQFQAIAQQTRPPTSVAAYVNPPMVAAQPGVPILDEEVLSLMINWRNSVNDGAWPRFYKAYELSTEYVAILDDDAIPGPAWLEEAIRAVSERNVCVAVTGALVDQDLNVHIVGPGSDSEETVVDFGRQGWVFKREWINHFMLHQRLGHRNYGWGVHMASALQSVNIPTVVLPYKNDDQETWGTIHPEEVDGMRNIAEYDQLRRQVMTQYRDVGWQLLSDETPDLSEAE